MEFLRDAIVRLSGLRPHTVTVMGRSGDGRSIAIPDLAGGTVTTIKDTGTELIMGAWRITGHKRQSGGVMELSLRLPSAVVIDKELGRCTVRVKNLNQTFQGRALRTILNEAANAWNQSV